MSEVGFQEFAREYHDEVASRTGVEGGPATPTAAFTALVLRDLGEEDVIADGEAYDRRYEDKDLAADGHAFDGESHLDLFITHYSGEDPPPTLDKKGIGAHFRPLQKFADRLLKRYYTTLSTVQSDVFDLSTRVSRAHESKDLKRIRLVLFTDCSAEVVKPPPDKTVAGVTITHDVWDIQKLFQYLGGQGGEPIEFDFVAATGAPLPCVALPELGQDYRSFLSVLPAQILYDLYESYGPRLLELNVRSFLQASRTVNKGIQETLRGAPDRFFAYNNGISATAESVETVSLSDGGLGIRLVRGLQIVNGGQTTASIHHAVRHNKVDVSRVYVQVKLSEVRGELLGQLVPLISRYSNSQNKVSADDFSANHPFHVALERLSRDIPTPPVKGRGAAQATHWFYERARGQYAEAARARTDRAKFRQAYPPTQKFGKTDLAKFLNTWEGHPHWVSMGAQKNFVQFTKAVEKRPDDYPSTPEFFRKVVALALLFRCAEAAVKSQKTRIPAYRANVVAYSLAALAAWHASEIQLDRIWQRQAVPDEIGRFLTRVAPEVFDTIKKTAPGNVTEWAKKEECWQKVRALELSLDEPVAET